MEEVIGRITEYVTILRPELGEEENEKLLEFVTGMVVDRAIVFMNRDQLVADFEEDEDSEPPIPATLERSLAQVVVQTFRTLQAQAEGMMGVKAMSDNGQSVTFSERVADYLSSADDSEVFAGVTALLRKYMLGTVVAD